MTFKGCFFNPNSIQIKYTQVIVAPFSHKSHPFLFPSAVVRVKQSNILRTKNYTIEQPFTHRLFVLPWARIHKALHHALSEGLAAGCILSL